MDIQVTGRMRLEGQRGLVEGPALAGRQGRLVLASLALAERSVRRETLAARLWGEELTRAWERDLSALVSRLRGAIEDVGLADVATIASDGATYELEADAAVVDVRRARAAAVALESARTSADRADALALARAVLEVTARPLLPGEEAAWIDEARSELARLRVRALEGAAESELADGHATVALDHLREALDLEPFRETAHRLWMRCQLALGNRAEAVRGYERLRRLLAEELGVDPAPETERLHLAALRGADPPTGRPAPSAATAPPPSAAASMPPIHYARNGRVSLAYQVVGEGDVDLVVVPGWVSNVELAWHEPRMAGFLRRLADRCRLILFDKRGTGLSDPVPIEDPPPLETRMDDVRAVMDAAASERAVLLGFSEGGAMSLLFAASHPDRTAGLALWGTWCRQMRDDDFPLGWTREEGLRRFVRPIQRDGIPPSRLFAPSVADDPAFQEWFERYARQSASPGMAIALLRANAPMDLRGVLPTIRVPTLVLHRTHDVLVEVGQGRYLAEHIPGARMVEFAGRDHWPWIGDGDPILAELLDFVESCSPARPTAQEILTTVVAASLPAGAPEGDIGRLVGEARGLLVERGESGIVARFDGPGRAVACARALVERWSPASCAAVHTGQVRLVGDRVEGITVDVARAALTQARPGEVLATRTVLDLAPGSVVRFHPRGAVDGPGGPSSLPLLSVE